MASGQWGQPANARPLASAFTPPPMQIGAWQPPGPGFFPDGTPVGAGAGLPQLQRDPLGPSGFRNDLNAAAGRPIDRAFNALADNQRDARQRALADRDQALRSADRLQQVLSGPDAQAARTAAQRLTRNPFGPEFIGAARGILKDQRAKQLQAAQAALVQQYAALGRPIDPVVLAMLNQQMANESNSNLRSLLTDTAGRAFQADSVAAQQLLALLGTNIQGQSAASDAVYRILANTEYGTGQEDLALLLRLAQAQ